MHKTTTHRRLFPILALALSFFATVASGAEWQTDYEKALATAKASNKCVLLDFNGSDWCGPCIEMRKVVFSKPAFITYANKNLILVDVDYPQRKVLPDKVTKQNERLKKQYDIDRSGYPTVVLLDPNGKVLGRLEGYDGEKPADMIAWVEKLRKKKSNWRLSD
jgi:thioredoxin-related protein